VLYFLIMFFISEATAFKSSSYKMSHQSDDYDYSSSNSKKTSSSSSKQSKPTSSANGANSGSGSTGHSSTTSTSTGSIVYQFVLGLIEGLDGGNIAWEKCLPASLQSSNLNDTTQTGPVTAALSNVHGPLLVVEDAVKLGVKVMCTFKSDVKKYLSGKINPKAPSLMQLMVKKLHKLKKNKGIGSDIEHDEEHIISSGKHIVSTGEHDASHVVSKGTHNVEGIISDVWQDIADKILPMIQKEVQSISASFYQVFHSTLWKNIVLFISCLKSGAAGAQQLVKVFYGFETKIDALIEATAADVLPVVVVIVDLIIDMICNYEDFLKAFNYLADAIQASNAAQKSNYSGRFIGGLINAVGTS